jgi:hypothetical protein
MEQCILVLVVSPSIDNAMVDWLLDRDDIQGFTSASIYGHGDPHHTLSSAEKVSGRKKQVMFRMHLPKQTAQEIISSIKKFFKGASIHYWVTPMLLSGHID